MRVLYGLCGEGMGHATRSRVVVEHLRERGHDVMVMASGRAYPFMRKHHDQVVEISGFTMRCRDGAMDVTGSIADNLSTSLETLSRNGEVWRRAEAFDPHVAVTDYEFLSYSFGRAHDLPVVSIDNAQVLLRCVVDPEILAKHRHGLKALEDFTTLKSWRCDRYVITTFFYPPVRKGYEPTTALVPPILRREAVEVLGREVVGEHVLVYKTASLDDASFLSCLSQLPKRRFLVYGTSPDSVHPPNCVRRDFDEVGFLSDLSSCSAVVGNGGMSLLGEALSLRKPYLAVPVREQYEQVLNAEYVSKLGYGLYLERLRPRELEGFLDERETFAERLREVEHDRNEALYGALGRLLG